MVMGCTLVWMEGCRSLRAGAAVGGWGGRAPRTGIVRRVDQWVESGGGKGGMGMGQQGMRLAAVGGIAGAGAGVGLVGMRRWRALRCRGGGVGGE